MNAVDVTWLFRVEHGMDLDYRAADLLREGFSILT
jgi:hypothetical protein